jgi:hypothetical protein
VSVCDAKTVAENENSYNLRFSHVTLSTDTYRSAALMVGDRVTLEMAKVP